MTAILGGVLGIGACIYLLWRVFKGVKVGSIRVYSGENDIFTICQSSSMPLNPKRTSSLPKSRGRSNAASLDNPRTWRMLGQ